MENSTRLTLGHLHAWLNARPYILISLASLVMKIHLLYSTRQETGVCLHVVFVKPKARRRGRCCRAQHCTPCLACAMLLLQTRWPFSGPQAARVSPTRFDDHWFLLSRVSSGHHHGR